MFSSPIYPSSFTSALCLSNWLCFSLLSFLFSFFSLSSLFSLSFLPQAGIDFSAYDPTTQTIYLVNDAEVFHLFYFLLSFLHLLLFTYIYSYNLIFDLLLIIFFQLYTFDIATKTLSSPVVFQYMRAKGLMPGAFTLSY